MSSWKEYWGYDEAPAKSTDDFWYEENSWGAAAKRLEDKSNQMLIDSKLMCPDCGGKVKKVKLKSLSAGKAAIGGVVAGPVGAIVGAAMGGGKVHQCQRCGKVL